MPLQLQRRGRCHVFGDDIPLDDGLIPFEMAIGRIDDPALLVPHLLRLVDAGFPARVQPGDIVVAGRAFACGKPHFQGFIAMAALGLSVVCASMPYKSVRGAISKGVPVMPGVDAGHFATGDEVVVDFVQGTVVNASRRSAHQGTPLAPDLVALVLQGGTRGALSAWLAEHPEAAQPFMASRFNGEG